MKFDKNNNNNKNKIIIMLFNFFDMCTNPRYIINPTIKKLRDKGEFDVSSTYPPYFRFNIKNLAITEQGVHKQNFDNTYTFYDSKGKKYSVPHYIKVGCRRCHECLKQRTNEIVSRLQLELNKHKDFAFFVTLTYNDLNVPTILTDRETLITLNKSDLQKFFKRLKMRLFRKGLNIDSFKYYAIGEYGFKNTSNKRPHYHCIIFFDQLPFNEFFDEILKCWQFGQIDVKQCETNMLRYCANAHSSSTKLFPIHEFCDKPFSIFSKGLGIPNDSDYDYIKLHKSVYVDGSNYPLDRYVKNKVFNTQEKHRQYYYKSVCNGIEDDICKRLDNDNISYSEFKKLCHKIDNDNKELTNRYFNKYILKRK